MINEEYNYDDVSDYLDNHIDLLISGTPGKDVREKFCMMLIRIFLFFRELITNKYNTNLFKTKALFAI